VRFSFFGFPVFFPLYGGRFCLAFLRCFAALWVEIRPVVGQGNRFRGSVRARRVGAFSCRLVSPRLLCRDDRVPGVPASFFFFLRFTLYKALCFAPGALPASLVWGLFAWACRSFPPFRGLRLPPLSFSASFPVRQPRRLGFRLVFRSFPFA